MIAVLSHSAHASVQDLGRFGALRWGVGIAGAMDRPALAGGNLLLGNPVGAAGLEVQVFPFEVRFDRDTAFALTGADCDATLDGARLLPWSCAAARPGSVLRLGLPRTEGPWCGARAYLCVAGGIDVPPVLGSRSTQVRGGLGGVEGRTLRAGDVVAVGAPAGPASPPGTGLTPPGLALPFSVDGISAVRVLPAAEHDNYTPASRRSFWAEPWRVTPQSDRYGFRLAGPTLEPIAPLELRSHGIVPGVIQVPHGGQPIVQMCDAQPSGGYPKIGTVIEADLWRLGQAPIGSRIRFVETDWDGALAALDELDAWLVAVGRGLDLLQPRKSP